MSNPYKDAGQSRVGVWLPPRPVQNNVINDSTSGISIGAQASGYVFLLAGSNINRQYILIQNNSATAAIAVGFGAPNAQGLKILAGGYYERELYCPTQQIYATLLAASAAGDYVSIEEGSELLQ